MLRLPSRPAEGVRAFRHPAYRILYVALVARGSQVWLQFVALPLLVLDLGGSAGDVGLVTGLFLIPIAIVAPIAGVVGDRVDRRRALVAMAAYGAVHGLVMAAVVAVDAMTIPLLALFSGLYGLLNAAEIPIRLAFIAQVVPRADLANGVVMGQFAFVVTRIVAPAIGGLLAATLGLGSLFGLIGLAGLVVAIATYLVRVAPSSAPGSGSDPGRALVEGLRYSAVTSGVRQPLLLLGAVSIFGLSFQVVLPIYAVERLALDSQGYGLLLGVMGVGALVASLPLAYLDPIAARRTVLVASIGVAGGVLVLALTTFAPLAFLVVGVAGAASNAALSSASVVLQHAVHGDVRARVLGLQAALFQGGQGIGGFGMGLATEALGIVAALVWGALLVGISTLVLWPTWRATPPEPDPDAPPSRAPADRARPAGRG
jgi:MFS family permease